MNDVQRIASRFEIKVDSEQRVAKIKIRANTMSRDLVSARSRSHAVSGS